MACRNIVITQHLPGQEVNVTAMAKLTVVAGFMIMATFARQQSPTNAAAWSIYKPTNQDNRNEMNNKSVRFLSSRQLLLALCVGRRDLGG